MSSTTTTSPAAGQKRAYQTDDSTDPPPLHDTAPGSPPQSAASASSAFRNVSACNRCRTRKNRCDARLPSCSTCEKVNARCVGYDPITKREIPRSYVYFLETRLSYFESLLKTNNVAYEPAETYDADSKLLGDASQTSPKPPERRGTLAERRNGNRGQDEKDKIDKLVSNIGMVSVQGASDSRFLGTTSGISFARVVLSAVKSSVSTSSSERGPKASNPALNGTTGGSSMRDTYFGLQTKPTFREAPFPERHLGEKLINLYFEYANPQIPILHRGEFVDIVDRAYSVEPSKRTPREMYLLNIVFAIGAGIIWGSSDPSPETIRQTESASKRPKLASQQAQPEEYHASAIVHLGAFLSSSSFAEGSERTGGDLEELQAVLLLAAFALMRPVAPGLWYIVGVAMRLAVDLGLHYEDGTEIEDLKSKHVAEKKARRSIDAREKGRREWTRDFRRRLWWCTYNFDRLVSTCVGRPFGITDQVVTTAFPSVVDDKFISRSGGLLVPETSDEPSYKRVSHHYFKLRLLQSEILQVLQYQQAQQVRVKRRDAQIEGVDTTILSPYLSQHTSFRSWRQNIDQRLYDWKESAPLQTSTGVGFDRKFLELNYWQAVIMLYRQSLAVPAAFADELSPTEEVSSPGSTLLEEKDDEDHVFLKCAEAGQNTLKLYRQLHRQRLVNYTYLATHHLFMAGISFLYAVWHSPAVRSRLTLDSFDFTVLAATSVLGDLMEKCPPAEACRDAFERMSKATLQMCLSTPGFGFSKDHTPRPHVKREPSFPEPSAMDSLARTSSKEYAAIAPKPQKIKRPPPQFDMDLGQLFPEDLDVGPRPSAAFPARTQRQATFARPAVPQPYQTSPFTQPMQMPSYTNHSTSLNRSTTSPISANQPAPQLSPSQASTSSFVPSYQTHSSNADMMDYSTSSLPEGMDYMSNSYDYSAVGDQDSPLYPLDLGFGPGVMGFDYSHDWSEGQQLDLFEGFFFGNNGGAGGAGDNGEGPSGQ